MAYVFEKLKASASVYNSYGFSFHRLDKAQKLPVPELSAQNGVLDIKDPSGKATSYHIDYAEVSPVGEIGGEKIYLNKRALPYDFKRLSSLHSGWDIRVRAKSEDVAELGGNGQYDASDQTEDFIIEMPHELRGKTFKFDCDTFDSYYDSGAMYSAPTTFDYTHTFMSRVHMQFECSGETFNAIDFSYIATADKSQLTGATRYEILVHRMRYVRTMKLEDEGVEVYKDDNSLYTSDGFIDSKYDTIKILHPPYAFSDVTGRFGEFSYNSYSPYLEFVSVSDFVVEKKTGPLAVPIGHNAETVFMNWFKYSAHAVQV